MENSDYQNCNSRNTINNFLIELTYKGSICSIGALMKEIMPVETEKNDFEHRVKSIMFETFRFWDHRHFDAKKQMKKNSIKACSLIVDFVIATLMKEVELVVIEGNEHDFREKPLLKALFQKFGS